MWPRRAHWRRIVPAISSRAPSSPSTTDDGAITSTVATSIASAGARELREHARRRPRPWARSPARPPGDHPDLLAEALPLDDADDRVEEHPRPRVDRLHRLLRRPQARERFVEVEQGAQLPPRSRGVAPACRPDPIRRAAPTPARRDGARRPRATRECVVEPLLREVPPPVHLRPKPMSLSMANGAARPRRWSRPSSSPAIATNSRLPSERSTSIAATRWPERRATSSAMACRTARWASLPHACPRGRANAPD